MLDHKALRLVSPLKGKFRSFLVASLQNYLSDEADSAHCQKRGGNIEFVPLDIYRLAALDFLTAEQDRVEPTTLAPSASVRAL
jgi:hypothetical protein